MWTITYSVFTLFETILAVYQLRPTCCDHHSSDGSIWKTSWNEVKEKKHIPMHTDAVVNGSGLSPSIICVLSLWINSLFGMACQWRNFSGK